MSKLPSFQFYPGDWMKDAELRLCSIFARGLLVDLLCIMFEAKHRGRLVLADGITPWSDEQIADSVSGSDRETKVIALRELVANGVLKRDREYGFVYSSRLLRDEEIRVARVEAGSKGGSKTQANNKANDQAKSSSSSSSSSSTTVKDKHIAAPAAVAKRDATPPPYNLIAEQYVAAFGGLTHITEKRRKAIRARWSDEWWRENWQSALDRGSQSSFLKGSGETGWRISFDFFLKPDSVARILEGVYDDGKQNNPNNKHLTAAERREQLNADSFQYLRDAVAAQQRAAVAGIGNTIPSSTGKTLLLEEHGTAH